MLTVPNIEPYLGLALLASSQGKTLSGRAMVTRSLCQLCVLLRAASEWTISIQLRARAISHTVSDSTVGLPVASGKTFLWNLIACGLAHCPSSSRRTQRIWHEISRLRTAWTVGTARQRPPNWRLRCIGPTLGSILRYRISSPNTRSFICNPFFP